MKYSSIVAVMLILLTSCISLDIAETYDSPGWPGYIETSESLFDGRKQISLEPAYLGKESGALRIGLRWHDNLESGKYLLIAEWDGAINFEPDRSLDVRADDVHLSLEPADPQQYGVTDRKFLSALGYTNDAGNFTKKQYWITQEQLDRIIKAEKVVFRVHFLDSYYDDQLEPVGESQQAFQDYPNIYAKSAIPRFLGVVQQ